MNEIAKIQSTTTYLFSIKNSLPAGSLKTTSEPKQLVGGFNPSEKYWSNWIMSPNRGETSKKENPPPVRKPELNKASPKKKRRGLRLAREASLPLFSRGTIPIAGPRQAILLTEHFKNFVANFLKSWGGCRLVLVAGDAKKIQVYIGVEFKTSPFHVCFYEDCDVIRKFVLWYKFCLWLVWFFTIQWAKKA